jgi:hypothetical protein
VSFFNWTTSDAVATAAAASRPRAILWVVCIFILSVGKRVSRLPSWKIAIAVHRAGPARVQVKK